MSNDHNNELSDMIREQRKLQTSATYSLKLGNVGDAVHFQCCVATLAVKIAEARSLALNKARATLARSGDLNMAA